MDIKLTSNDKKYINSPDDVYGVMQRILLRENKIDQEKEYFWMIGLNMAGYILYIELVSLGSVKKTIVEPMNVFRVAVLKGATRVVIVHNHPSGRLSASDEDKECTDRLIQVGRILDIQVEDHLIISTTSYVSFKAMGLIEELGKSIKYVPSYQLVEKIRKEEKAIAKDAIKTAKDSVKIERQEKEKILTSAVRFLLERQLDVGQIARILEVTLKDIESIIKKENI